MLLIAWCLPGVASAVCNAPGDPDCVKRVESYGPARIDFFATGASFATISDPTTSDRPDGLVTEAQVVVPARALGPGVALRAAFLYIGGSIFDEGAGPPPPDQTVEVQVPGSDAWVVVTADRVYRSGAIPAFPELTLFVGRVDLTPVMAAAGGQMAGTYRVRGFDVEIFYRMQTHTAANASFSLVLVYEGPALAPRTITLFEGMQEVLGSTITVGLEGFTVDDPAQGSLTFYALEGDCNPDPLSCLNGNNQSGPERITVGGSRPPVRLSDEINPPNDIFNRTINTVDPPMRDVPNLDIDTFDISQALAPGDTQVTVEVTTPFPSGGATGELIGLAYIIAGIDVLASELGTNTRVMIVDPGGRGHHPPGWAWPWDPGVPGQPDAGFGAPGVDGGGGPTIGGYLAGEGLQIIVVISNTGDLAANGVRIEVDLPAFVTAWGVQKVPAGATVQTIPKGGLNQTGQAIVVGVNVAAGDEERLVLWIETDCPLPNDVLLVAQARIIHAAENFVRSGQVPLVNRSRCDSSLYLYGGGGCQTAMGVLGEGGWLSAGLLALLAALLLLSRRARKTPLAGVLVLVAASGTGCGASSSVDLPAPGLLGSACPRFADEMVAIPSIEGSLAFCMDRFESGVDNPTALGNEAQPIAVPDGTTTAIARSIRNEMPIGGLTWFQARAACANAGKRLCSADEWVLACQGDEQNQYPYGQTFEPHTCNGGAAGREGTVPSGGMTAPAVGTDGSMVAGGCVSKHGVYDLSGNLWEWTSTPLLSGSRRGLGGGGYKSNLIGLRCVATERFATPAEVDDTYGFRCCVDYPY